VSGAGAARSTGAARPPRGLRFGTDDEPGITRTGHRRPHYRDDLTGDPIEDPEVLARIRALAVPPAWTDVWISADPCSHVQATGRDARGRKQYRYHSDFRQHQEEAKFELLVPFGHALPALRRRVGRDLSRRGLPRDRVVAVVVELLERTLVRVGNEEYARTNGSFGLTTLRVRHARIEGPRLRMRFNAKSAKVHEVDLADPRLARLVRRCQDLPGQLLFQYVEDDGAPHPVRSSDVNDYLRETTGLDITAKTFRTWHASVFAAAALGGHPAPEGQRARKAVVTAMLKVVSAELDNTPAVCRRSYVHPALVDRYLTGDLAEAWAGLSARGSRDLSRDERKLLALLDAAA
jgi:DNA topoisomerase I